MILNSFRTLSWTGSARSTLRTMALTAAIACSEPTTDPDGEPAAFDGFPVLVTDRSEQSLSAPSNGSVALLPILQFDGTPTSGATVIVRMVTSAGAAVGPAVNLGTNAGDVPLAAFDGTNFLVVYQLSAAGGTNLYGQFFNTSGVPVSAAFEITTSDDAPAVWSVTYGAGTYLVTYHRVISDNVTGMARFVSPTGTVGGEMVFNDLGGMSAAAFDGTRFLIAYSRERSSVWGTLLHPDGTLTPTAAIDGSPGASNGAIKVAYTGTNYIVVFGDSTANGWDVHAQAVSPGGALVGTMTTVSAASGTQLPLGILADGGNALVTWSTGGQGSSRQTFATFLDASGGQIGTARPVFTPDQGDIASPIFSKLGGSYLAVVNRRATTWDVYGKLVTVTP